MDHMTATTARIAALLAAAVVLVVLLIHVTVPGPAYAGPAGLYGPPATEQVMAQS